MMRALMTKTLFVLSMLLSAQALAFDVGGLSYAVINATDVEVTGRASGNTATDIVIPATAWMVAEPPTALRPLGSLLSHQRPHQRDYSRQRYDHWGLLSPQRPHQRDYSRQRYDHWGLCFLGNALTSVIIPDSVTTIGVCFRVQRPHQRDYSRQRDDHWGLCFRQQRPHQRDYSRQRYDHWGVCFLQQRPHQRDYSRQRYDHWGLLSPTTPSPA